MVAYLKRTETPISSRESLLKQQEALAELDASIDDWSGKLEQAESRRLRVRQKLLEHVAASLTLTIEPPESPAVYDALLTPPRSPGKDDSSPRIKRNDVESIKIYADGEVLDLFSSIEEAIGDMCDSPEPYDSISD
jgi:hypothetical protein